MYTTVLWEFHLTVILYYILLPPLLSMQKLQVTAAVPFTVTSRMSGLSYGPLTSDKDIRLECPEHLQPCLPRRTDFKACKWALVVTWNTAGTGAEVRFHEPPYRL